jgi:predicted dehydrogenase
MALETVRFGIVGLGNIGGFHATYLPTLDHAAVTAICESDNARLETWAKKLNVAGFTSPQELIESGLIDAVIIATPHTEHVPLALAAMAKGLHVLCEKPIAVGVKAARELNEAYEKKYSHLKFGMMFQLRTSPVFKKVRELIAEGELGEVSRLTWIATTWFRTWAYYASGGWRATWTGEGGGVTINQCPHNFDMIQHLLGMMPTRVTAVAAVGKRHPIEVEDEVSAILEFPNGAIGHFVTTTGEAPGTDRLEIAGDRGKLVVEGGKIKFSRTRQAVQEFNRTCPQAFASPERWEIDVPVSGEAESHKFITQRFIDVVRQDLPNNELIAPGPEGVRGLELGNAILMAGLTRQPVTLPLDGEAYEVFLKDMARQYGGRKTLQTKDAVVDMNASFKK